jgi:hypothetical protein
VNKMPKSCYFVTKAAMMQMDATCATQQQEQQDQGQQTRKRLLEKLHRKKPHLHKVFIPYNVKVRDSVFSGILIMFIENENDEYVAESVPAYCPRKEKSIDVLRQQLLGTATDFSQTKWEIGELAKKHGLVSEGEIKEFTNRLINQVFERTQDSTFLVELMKSIVCCVQAS